MTPWRGIGLHAFPALVRIGAWTVYLFLLAPFFVVVPISFGSTAELVFPPRSYTLVLYREFFTSESWLGALLMSVEIAVSAAVIATLVAVPAAYGLARARFRGQDAVRSLLFSPMMMPHVVIALGLYLFFIRIGISGSFIGVVLGHSILIMPFVIVVLTAGMRGVERNLEVAAGILGATQGRILLQVVVPLLKRSILTGFLFAFILSFDEVVVAWFLVGASGNTLPVKMFSALQTEISPVIAVVATLLTALSTIVCLAVSLVEGKRA